MTTYTRTNGKKSFTSRIATILSSIVFVGLLSSTAQAAPIVGSLEYNGIFVPSDGTTGVTLASATYLDFLSPSTFALGDGHMAGLYGIGTLDLFDFYITPFSGTVSSPVLVWSDGTGATDLSFSLTSLTIVDQSTNSIGDTLVLNGRGIFTQTGFDTTEAVWSLSATDTGDPTPVLTFAASSAVSEPSMLALLGLTLLGMGWTRRSKRRKLAA